MRHTLTSNALVLAISADLANVTSHHAGWCSHLVVLIHNYLLLGIYYVDIGSLTSYHIILRRVLLLRFHEIKA
jgi:hypothetical protein